MLECTKVLRTKAIVHFLGSTGMRPEGLIDPILRIKHLMELKTSNNQKCYAIKIYDGDESGYWTFLTPEATQALDNYHQWRRESRNEKLDDESPIFGIMDARNAKGNFLTDKSLRWMLNLLIKASGMKRTKISERRYDKAIVYMFRKRFNTILKLENDVNSNIAEKLMAHKKGLDGTYLQPTREECFKEFVKAIPELTVNQAEKQKIQLDKKQQEIDELQSKIIENEELVNRVRLLEREMRIKEKYQSP